MVQQEARGMAVERQQSISSNHKVAQTFWKRLNDLDTWNGVMANLSDSRNAYKIAVDLNHFEQIAAQHHLEVHSLPDLKSTCIRRVRTGSWTSRQ
jgi:hypothetical protein